MQPQSNGKQSGSSSGSANKAAERKVAALQKDKAALKASLSKAEADTQAAWQQVFEKDRECLDKVRAAPVLDLAPAPCPWVGAHLHPVMRQSLSGVSSSMLIHPAAIMRSYGYEAGKTQSCKHTFHCLSSEVAHGMQVLSAKAEVQDQIQWQTEQATAQLKQREEDLSVLLQEKEALVDRLQVVCWSWGRPHQPSLSPCSCKHYSHTQRNQLSQWCCLWSQPVPCMPDMLCQAHLRHIQVLPQCWKHTTSAAAEQW